ncbi:hypothetical protein [Lagierella sp.]|uniref:hypothetical protein n=1 Tax=Lagierella sp. TaxID=2849657 RepID=UPI00260890EA|nr:hypothetical protein [Lagierella sp.]
MRILEDKFPLDKIDSKICQVKVLDSTIEKIDYLEKQKDEKQKEIFFKLQEIEFLKSLNGNEDFPDEIYNNINDIVLVEFLKSTMFLDKLNKDQEIINNKYQSIVTLLKNRNFKDNQKEVEEILNKSLSALETKDIKRLKSYERVSLMIVNKAIEEGTIRYEDLSDDMKNLNKLDSILLNETGEYQINLIKDIQRLDKLLKDIDSMLLAVIPIKNNIIM